MASKNSKRMAAVAALATSVVLMGGAAFASPASPVAGSTGVTSAFGPVPIGKGLETVRHTLAEGDRQIRQLHWTF
jgi:hypothetical protein